MAKAKAAPLPAAKPSVKPAPQAASKKPAAKKKAFTGAAAPTKKPASSKSVAPAAASFNIPAAKLASLAQTVSQDPATAQETKPPIAVPAPKPSTKGPIGKPFTGRTVTSDRPSTPRRSGSSPFVPFEASMLKRK